MADLLRISGKDLGAMALPEFCARCFWLKRRTDAGLPFQIFPGIFSSIDSFTKKVVHGWFDHHGSPPPWLRLIPGIVGYKEPPHYSRFSHRDSASGVLLTGAPDAVLRRADGSLVIADYKTAKFTDNQDALLPMYVVQLNAYAFIAQQLGWERVSGLALIYAEPQTDQHHAAPSASGRPSGFSMDFAATVKEIALDTLSIPPGLMAMRRIVEQPTAPAGRLGCKDCRAVDRLVELISKRNTAGT